MVSQIVQRKIEKGPMESILLVFLISTFASLGEVSHTSISDVTGTSYAGLQEMRQSFPESVLYTLSRYMFLPIIPK